jgi:hypothetical protein
MKVITRDYVLNCDFNGRISRQVQGFLQLCCSYGLTLQNETVTQYLKYK